MLPYIPYMDPMGIDICDICRLLLEAEASDSRTLIDYRQMEDARDSDPVGLCGQEESEIKSSKTLDIP